MLTNTDWTKDPRTIAIVSRLHENPPVHEAYKDFSNSSWGFKTYFRWVGDAVDQLDKIRSEYTDRAFAIELTDRETFLAIMRSPWPADIIDAAMTEKVAA